MKKAKNRDKNAARPGPMDTCVMVCKACLGKGHLETIFVPHYNVVWIAPEHPQNKSKKPAFNMQLQKYGCIACGCADAVLPPGFELARERRKAEESPMTVVGGRKTGDGKIPPGPPLEKGGEDWGGNDEDNADIDQ
jgi:hypothetical protein